MVALGAGIDYLAQYATPEQVQRTCYATFSMFVSWSAYAAWRYTDEYPPAWKYLAARQHDSFYTSMTLLDPIGGYVLRRISSLNPVSVTQRSSARRVVLVNDLLSVAKDLADEQPPVNMVLQIRRIGAALSKRRRRSPSSFTTTWFMTFGNATRSSRPCPTWSFSGSCGDCGGGWAARSNGTTATRATRTATVPALDSQSST